MPTSWQTLTRWYAESGASLDGLIITLFPHTSAGISFQDGIAIGKFQGVIRPQTPSGTRIDKQDLFGSSEGVVWPCSRLPSPAM